MKKLYISCCAECSAHVLRLGQVSFCKKKDKRIDDDCENEVNPALVGFPDWCPLDAVETGGNATADYKKNVRCILKILQVLDDFSSDDLAEASHYLNSVVEDAKKKAAS